MVRPIDALAKQWPPFERPLEHDVLRLMIYCDQDNVSYLSLHLLKRVYKILKKSTGQDWSKECKWLVSAFIDPSIEHGTAPTVRHGSDSDFVMRLYAHALCIDPGLSTEGPLLAEAAEELRTHQPERSKVQAQKAQGGQQQDLPLRPRPQREVRPEIEVRPGNEVRPEYYVAREYSGTWDSKGNLIVKQSYKPQIRRSTPVQSHPLSRQKQSRSNLDISRHSAPPMKQSYKELSADPEAEQEPVSAGREGIRLTTHLSGLAKTFVPAAVPGKPEEGAEYPVPLNDDREDRPISADTGPRPAIPVPASPPKAMADEPIASIKTESVDENSQDTTVVFQAVITTHGHQTTIPFSPDNFEEAMSHVNAFLDWKNTEAGRNTGIGFDTFMSIRAAVAPMSNAALSSAVVRRRASPDA
ncbi:hypothetical protein K490DRAFT_62201 [Saccharata proteae CBS 121410]|uniref:Uncharacterized protein n=1 Tax=Saccharata proteae CBS 121410 TaxID=1314787 RepID=A0A9P4I2V9_9PEZI|nr:hypothetical protein K490DRAFT_62201 [Saccharata proteae CBS 121410]